MKLQTLLAGSLLLVWRSASLSVQGYIVDNYCWNKPNHIGIDSAPLGTSPGAHVLHCLTCCGCPNEGYVILEKLATPTSEGFTYGRKYQLDNVGDSLMVELATAEMARGGDRPFNEQINATGVLIGNELRVSTLCFTPSVGNTGGETVCHGSSTSSTRANFQTSSTVPTIAAGSTTTVTIARPLADVVAAVSASAWTNLAVVVYCLVIASQAGQ